MRSPLFRWNPRRRQVLYALNFTPYIPRQQTLCHCTIIVPVRRVPLHRGSPARLASSPLAKLFSLSISYRPFAVELSPATHLYPFRELEVETVNGTMTAVADRAVCQSVFRVKSALRIEPGRCGSFAKGASGGAAPAAAVSARPPPSEAAAVVHAASASAAAQQATPVARIRRAPLR